MKTAEEKLGQEPAFPLPSGVEVNYNENGVIVDTANGMSKRFYAACAAMQGLLANTNIAVTYEPEWTIEFAYACADELLKQEGEL